MCALIPKAVPDDAVRLVGRGAVVKGEVRLAMPESFQHVGVLDVAIDPLEPSAEFARWLHVANCGLEFPLGYPAAFAEVVCPSWKNPWLGVWKSLQRAIQDNPKNVNNRFEVAGELNRLIGLASGPFWGHPNGTEIPNLSWKTGGRSAGLRQYRHTETRVSGVQEVWKLYGQGSVGSQALVGIPWVASLWNHFGAEAEVWPFERGFGIRTVGPTIVLAEIWPGVIPLESRDGFVRDQIQVESLAAYFQKLDAEGNLAKLFARPDSLSTQQEGDCVSAEGWILGV